MFTQYRSHHSHSLRGFIMSIITAPQYHLTSVSRWSPTRRRTCTVFPRRSDEVPFCCLCCYSAIDTVYDYSNNQRLWSADDNDRRSKRFCSIAVLCVSFTRQIVKTRVIRLRVMEGPNARGQICLLCILFHSLLMDD